MITCERCNQPIVWVDDRYWGAVGSHAGICVKQLTYGDRHTPAGIRNAPHRPLIPDLTNRVELERWLG